MKILTAAQLAVVDQATIESESISSVQLMERAAAQCTDWLSDHFDRPAQFVLLCGPGNNGGDGLAIARLLEELGSSVLVFKSESHSADNKANAARLDKIDVRPLDSLTSHAIQPTDVIVDAMFGYGLSRPLSGVYASMISYVNGLGNIVVSIDVPSGLAADTPSTGEVIDADFTLTFQTPKLGFFVPENRDLAGEWIVLDIGLDANAIDDQPSPYSMIEERILAKNLPERGKFDHKGTYGHALLVAGSFGKVGAAILAAQAALRSGVGLLTVHAPRQATTILQIAVPEAMVSADRHDYNFSGVDTMPTVSAMGIGCGLGQHGCTTAGLKDLLSGATAPVVIDADGLNTISNNSDLLELIPPGSILTPHLKEFARLFGESENHFDRLSLLRKQAAKHDLVIVLKGAHTAVCDPSGTVTFNTTGNPGMATAGSGDVLTGIITALLAQKMPPHLAARTGVYLHGLAGDLAAEKRGNEALIASDIIDHLGDAFNKLRDTA